MSLTFGAICVDFFWRIHPDHRLIKYKTAPLITIYTFLLLFNNKSESYLLNRLIQERKRQKKAIINLSTSKFRNYQIIFLHVSKSFVIICLIKIFHQCRSNSMEVRYVKYFLSTKSSFNPKKF